MATTQQLNELHIEGDANTNMIGHLQFFDARIYRKLGLWNATKKDVDDGGWIYPHFDMNTYVMDLRETPGAIQNQIEEFKLHSGLTGTDYSDGLAALEKKYDATVKYINENYNRSLAPHSFVHPYALVKLAGATGDSDIIKQNLTYDRYNHRKWYEIDGDQYGGYASAPTTTKLIQWGNEDTKYRTPYSFQDFVFCKHWGKIPNNRLITLRRYAAPVNDDLSFFDYDTNSDNSEKQSGSDGSSKTMIGSNSKDPWTPLATAVTYFGDDTGNSLKSLLAFSAQYNWAPIGNDRKSPLEISSAQVEEGNGLIGTKGKLSSLLTSGMGAISRVLGFMGEVNGQNSIDLDAALGNPPDPYLNGPYENRILGPVNVITDTWKRERGLKFTNDGLKITFNYVARPIAGINNKAVLLDLLSNILVMTYSSGSWFGGMWRYESSNPAVYPFKFGDAMNKLYKGNIFGDNGAIVTLTQKAFGDAKGGLVNMLPDAIGALKDLVGGALNAISGAISGVTAAISNKLNGTSEENADKVTEAKKKKAAAQEQLASAMGSRTVKGIEKVIAAKAMRGATIPYIQSQRALLMGYPVGDWHLTIGNPLNPIAMIGNLICKDVQIEFSDELGPDDFPIGFKAVVTLAHGLGRDRDAIESMFNRGMGRIYTLPGGFRSSADGETKVDEYTGGDDSQSSAGRTTYEETRNTYFGNGRRFIARIQQSELSNKGYGWSGNLNNYSSLVPTREVNSPINTEIVLSPWQTAFIM